MTLTQSMISAIAGETVGELLARRHPGVPEGRVIRRRLSARLKTQSGPDVIAVGLAIASAPAMKAARARWVGWGRSRCDRACSARPRLRRSWRR